MKAMVLRWFGRMADLFKRRARLVRDYDPMSPHYCGHIQAIKDGKAKCICELWGGSRVQNNPYCPFHGR
jgi:hypothetical protein